MRIPRDLKPGDRLWYSKTKYATVSVYNRGAFEFYFNTLSVHAYVGGCKGVRYTEDGREVDGDTPPITRIERIASKAKKVKRDGDAEFIRSICDFSTPAHARRLRRIAKRLEGGPATGKVK